MWSFFRSDTEQLRHRVRHMDASLRTSFLSVRRDTQNLGQWAQYLQEKTERQQAQLQQMTQEISSLNEELSAIPKTPQEIKKIIDQYYSYDALLSRLKYIEQRVEEFALKGVPIQQPLPPQAAQQPAPPSSQEMQEIRQKLAALEQKKQSLKEKIIKRITKNSKEYVKGIIQSYIRKYEQVAALQLKEMVVDDQQLCSKSSFYRLMEEIEQLEGIGVVREGKEKRYFLKAIKRNPS